MLIKTHLMITLFFSLLLISFVKSPVFFLVISLFSTYLPDIDSKKSKAGNHFFFRPLQWISKHRGILHSFTFLFFLIFILVLFLPVLALPFFIGYCSHLLADSFTPKGVRFFYPIKKVSSWKIKTGGVLETNIFLFFLIADIFLFVIKFSVIF